MKNTPSPTSLITGGNAGIGYATALELAEKGLTVVILVRTAQKGETAVARLKQQSGNPDIDYIAADLGSQTAVRQAAATFQQRYPRLHILINNAAIIPLQRQTSPDGLELQLAVNHLAPFLLTHLLLDILKASAPARIINVSSGVHSWHHINFFDLQNEQAYHSSNVYAQTKQMNVLFTAELARRLAGSGVTVNALSPGVINTKLYQAYMGRRELDHQSSTGHGNLAELRRGAATSVFLATSPEVATVTGRYFANSRLQETAVLQDRFTAQKLWQVSTELTGLNV